MAALVYRVSCASRGDLWFADGVEAEAAAQDILRGGEAVGLYPVPVPETAREFVAFVEGYCPRRPYASGGIVPPGFYTVGEVPLPYVIELGCERWLETPLATAPEPEATSWFHDASHWGPISSEPLAGPEALSAERQVAAAILGVFIEKRLQEHEILAALEAVRCDTAETRAAVRRTFGGAVKAPERCPDAASCDRGCEVRHFVGEEVPGACRQRRAGADAYEITEDEILASSAKHFVRRERDPVSGEIVTRSLVQDR